ncbi:MAG: KOW domain-containing RNA-binding protein [Clostridiales bacterium]|nr:KOW domain-containing RNA-binding protein [Clostridiales bacterium]
MHHSEPKIGDMVVSLSGHDEGKYFVVIAEMSADFVLIADGKGRTVEKPKLKRKKHLRVVAESGEEHPTNAALRKRIKKFISERRMYAEK